MTTNSVQVEMQDGVAIVRLNRPPANAIDIAFAVELKQAVAGLERRRDVRAMIVTGAGRCFCAGLDLKVVPSYKAREQKRMVRSFNQLVGALYRFPHPTVAALNGHTVAGGLVLALTCDYRIAAEEAGIFGLTEARVGIPFPAAAIAVVKAELTPAAARRLVLLGARVGPQAMLDLGVIDELIPGRGLMARAVDAAHDASRMPQGAYARIKKQLRSAALEQIRRAAGAQGDPALRSWLTPDTAAAASRVLR